EISQPQVTWQSLGDLPVAVIRSEPMRRVEVCLKRVLDLAGGLAGLILVSPLMVLIAALIRFDSPGPSLYRSWRVGKNGRKFQCFKFRTMYTDADSIKDKLRALNERMGPTFKIEH